MSMDQQTNSPGSGRDQTRGADDLLALLYEELKVIAKSYLAQERAGHTFQPTALLHEAYLRLAPQSGVKWKSESHFRALAAQMMHRALIDHARAHGALKRGSDRRRASVPDNLEITGESHTDLVNLDDALQKLQRLDARQFQIVQLRFFGGLTVEQVAEVLESSVRSIEREWTMAKAWLRRELREKEHL